MLVIITISVYSLWESIEVADFLTQLSVGIVLIIPLVLIWGFKPILERIQGDKFTQEQKIIHSKEILCRIFEHLCSTELHGNEELELSIPVPLDEYYKVHNITDITIHDYLPINLDELFKSHENQEPEKYAFVPIRDNPVNISWGLSHLEHKEYSYIMQNYKSAEKNMGLWQITYKVFQTSINKLIQEKIINVFFSDNQIEDHVQTQIKFIIINAIMMNYSVYQRDITNVCKTTQYDIDSKKLYDAALTILHDNAIISQHEKLNQLYVEMNKALAQFKTDLKKLVTNTRDGVLVKGNCKGCSLLFP